MSDANRIRLRFEPELTPVRLEERMDLNAEIKVAVDSHLTGLGVAGMVCIGLGMLALIVGSILFGTGYPERWHGLGDVSYDDSTDFIVGVVLSLSAGIILLFLGTSMFFYGRTVLGSGHLDRYHLQEPLESE